MRSASRAIVSSSFSTPCMREGAGLERNEDLARGAQCVEGEDADVRRAVDQREVEAAGERRQCGREPRRAVFAEIEGELLLERREHDARGRKCEALAERAQRRAGELVRAARLCEHVVEVQVDALGVDAERERRVGLRIEVDDQDARPGSSRQPARFTVVVVFPQPPFWLTIAMVRMKRTLPRPVAPRAAPAPGSEVQPP